MNSLNILYEELDFKNGSLYPVMDNPSACPKSTDWIEKGEWLAAAKRAGAEKIFFVDNNPAAVFAECGPGLQEKIKAFNRIWCLARPRLLFLASPGEITVYDLAQKPVDEKKKEDWKKLKHLDILHDLTKVSRELQKYHRDHVESGRVFADQRFGDLKNRADKALIRDLKTVRRELIHAGLSKERVRFAHALIGRSIFIRYLEDRGILTGDYFLEAARQKAGWTDLIRNPVNRKGVDFSNNKTYYPRILVDKSFTYTLFRRLAHDFNGDMFPDVDEEEKVVTRKHLTLIQDLLYGDAGIQKKLFFYSYRFDIVPLDLISSIYEEFYLESIIDDENNSKKRHSGAYYTPPVLVEFVLSRILTREVLEKSPRVLDPACGSGIYLVEAFRRMVRHQWYKKKQPLTFDELKRILKEQIAGIEVNQEAAKITAFSLYLSMLHYLEPPAIDRQIKMGNRLPNLVATTNRSANDLHCILPGHAFDTGLIESNPFWKERFGEGCADVIVGNPPWGAPGKKADQETKERHKKIIDWCNRNNKPVGDQEPSQAFLWRALDFLEEKGKAGILVPAGVLFKHNTTTLKFRSQWFDHVKLDEVFNFTHVRKFFFKGAASPFLSICFSKEKQENSPVNYWSAKQSININKTQSIMLSRYDMHVLRPGDLSDITIWKELWFGRRSDTELLRLLQRQIKLGQFCNRKDSGQGFTEASKDKDAKDLQDFKCLDMGSFSRYDLLTFSSPPKKVKRLGILSAYDGHRLLVQRGIKEKAAPKGSITARYEVESFCFSNAINGLKLESPGEWKYKTILGIMWSSFARYFFFMTSSNWGLWHHEIHLDDELLQLPIVLDKSNPATKKVISIVDKLRGFHPQKRDILHPGGIPEEKIEAQRSEWEAELDEAVFDLYGLNEEERDLIRDFCDVTLPFLYNPFDSIGAVPVIEKSDLNWIEKYIHTFCRRWNVYLGKDEEMRAEVHIGAHGNMIAVEFFPSDKGDPWDLDPKDNKWGYVLEEIGKALPQPMGTSQILLDGLVHIVSHRGVIVIKRNEKRFWTRSLAREDADAAICKRMMEAIPNEGKPG
ncbi:MAG: N-6 DNA methylase [Candidatus Aminicenantes bacterium]|nr:MAG: N-6 DNA methylase [Candidatus Aminicenantes bacterium]